jgi:hypothetical protein
MNRCNLLAGLAAALGLFALLAPASASASCADRKMTGTILGGVGGALIGNSISGGGGGAVLGGLGGAVLGHEIAGSGCRSERREAYYRDQPRAEAPRAVRYVYYDQYGDIVSEGPAPGAGMPVAYRQAGAGECRTEMQSVYDNRGALTRTPVKVCAR